MSNKEPSCPGCEFHSYTDLGMKCDHNAMQTRILGLDLPGKDCPLRTSSEVRLGMKDELNTPFYVLCVLTLAAAMAAAMALPFLFLLS